MTEDSVMLSLKELAALEERRVFEEEERVRLDRLAKRQAAAAAAESARLAAERVAADRAAAQEAREQAEREEVARAAAIREGELLKARLSAEAELLAKEQARRVAAAEAAAQAAAQSALARSTTRANRGLVVAALVATLVAGLASTLGVRSSHRSARLDRDLGVLAATLSDERATSARLGAELAKREKENRDLARAVEDARSATSAALVASQPDSRPAPSPLGRDTRTKLPPSVGVGVNSSTCDPRDPLCGFRK